MADLVIPPFDPSVAQLQRAEGTQNELLRNVRSGEERRDVNGLGIPSARRAQIDKASKDFEALLVHQMLGAMWKTVPEGDLFGGGGREIEMYRDMLNQALSQSIAENRSIGVADVVSREMIRREALVKKEGMP